jgi:acetolactate synthase-1/2/3 large subunit
MTKKPAATLMHCGPGLANGLSLLHNAKRARVPIVNIVGDQATYHAPFDPPLSTDTEGLSRPVSVWVRRVTKTETLGADAAAAVRAARQPPCGIATLILPSDVSWNEGGAVGAALPVPEPSKVSMDAIRDAARALASREPALMLLNGDAVSNQGLQLAHRIAAKTGAQIAAPTFNTKLARGRGRYPLERIPYIVDVAVAKYAGIKHLILVGAGEPVTFFAYPGKPGFSTPKDAKLHVFARPEDDLLDALARLADELNCPDVAVPDGPRPALAQGRMTVEGAAATLAALMPTHAIMVDEGITLRDPFFNATANGPPHDWLGNIGGAIGGGLPLATGAAIAEPKRRVITITGDGSAMYAVQALWTQAREQLDVTTIILSNRKYAVLYRELEGVGEKHGCGRGEGRYSGEPGHPVAQVVQHTGSVPDRAPPRIGRNSLVQPRDYGGHKCTKFPADTLNGLERFRFDSGFCVGASVRPSGTWNRRPHREVIRHRAASAAGGG